ncbi:hypothetical protein GGS24DRAFT_457637 [Hypoxylon argillaceum]|nr:hypothetical protein GGS24DRAFT_457637 [Hypoxylon argillaceum]
MTFKFLLLWMQAVAYLITTVLCERNPDYYRYRSSALSSCSKTAHCRADRLPIIGAMLGLSLSCSTHLGNRCC